MRPRVIATGIAVIDTRTADTPIDRVARRRLSPGAQPAGPARAVLWRPALQSTDGG
jgi:hypothetical protein